MVACWRKLQAESNFDVFVIAHQARTQTEFGDGLMKGIPSHLLNENERNDEALIKQLVVNKQPDVIVICGWFLKPYRKLVTSSDLQHVAKIMGMDTPWQGTLRQHLARIVLRSYLKKIDRIVVTGERSWQYASRLGFQPEKIHRGLYGIGYQQWAQLKEKREGKEWPRSFLFVGRYASEKAIDIFVPAYQQYCSIVDQPWSLVCCGTGPLRKLLTNQQGIIDRGFVQPTEMAQVWQEAGAFVLPSRFDPWPLALVEAAAAGLPIICTDACGSAVEVVRPGYNGEVVAQNSPEQLANAMVHMHERHAELPLWGHRSQQLASPYAAEIWVQRWRQICKAAARDK